MAEPHTQPAIPEPAEPGKTPLSSTDRQIHALKRRLVREAGMAVAMLEKAVAALFALDVESAKAVRVSDDSVDLEEVAIEQEAYEVLALKSPFARDFRALTFILRVNTEIERVADHATSLAKVTVKVRELCRGVVPRWPTALTELGQRVPAMCHELLRAVLDEDVETARQLVKNDEVIDQLERRLFDETLELMRNGGHGEAGMALGLMVHRAGRELERVGDLMAGIAEDVVYLATGEIIRHEKRRKRPRVRPGA